MADTLQPASSGKSYQGEPLQSFRMPENEAEDLEGFVEKNKLAKSKVFRYAIKKLLKECTHTELQHMRFKKDK